MDRSSGPSIAHPQATKPSCAFYGTSQDAETDTFYGRFSTDLQKDTSIDDQLSQCRRVPTVKISDALIFSDTALSGTSAHNRPGLQKLLRMARQELCPFKRIVVADLSRLARNLEELLHIYKVLKFCGIDLFVAATGLDSRIPGFEMALTLTGMMDEEYVKGVRDKTRRGAIGCIERGHTPGGKCFGYDNVLVPASTPGRAKPSYRKVINRQQADVILRFGRMYAEGLGCARIAKKLNEDGVPSTEPTRKGCIPSWSPTTISAMLKNERYVGKVTYGKTTTVKDPDTHQFITRKIDDESQWITHIDEELRIIPEELWLAIQAERRRRNEGHQGSKEGGLNRTAASQEYLLSGHLICGLCRGSISIIESSRGYATYGCHYYRDRNKCTNGVKIDRRRLEAQFLQMIAASIGAPEYQTLIADEFSRHLLQAQRSEERSAQEALAKRDDLLREQASLTKEIKNLAQAIKLHGISGALSDELRQSEKRLEAVNELLKPKAKKKIATIPPPDFKEFIARQMANLVEVLAGDPVRAKQELSKRLGKLILTPECRDGHDYLVVTGDLKLFTADTLMADKAGIGFVDHYEAAKLSLDGFVLDPKLAKAA